MSTSLKCDGENLCGEHEGEVRKYSVTSEYTDWGDFLYCDVSVEADRTQGFRVELVDA